MDVWKTFLGPFVVQQKDLACRGETRPDGSEPDYRKARPSRPEFESVKRGVRLQLMNPRSLVEKYPRFGNTCAIAVALTPNHFANVAPY